MKYLLMSIWQNEAMEISPMMMKNLNLNDSFQNKPIPVSDLVDSAIKLIKQRAIKYQKRSITNKRD